MLFLNKFLFLFTPSWNIYNRKGDLNPTRSNLAIKLARRDCQEI